MGGATARVLGSLAIRFEIASFCFGTWRKFSWSNYPQRVHRGHEFNAFTNHELGRRGETRQTRRSLETANCASEMLRHPRQFSQIRGLLVISIDRDLLVICQRPRNSDRSSASAASTGVRQPVSECAHDEPMRRDKTHRPSRT